MKLISGGVAARHLGLSRSRVDQLMRAGLIRAHTVETAGRPINVFDERHVRRVARLRVFERDG
jgi:hypothetical protein